MSSSRKIGVLTFHRCINYGSYWQARSLVEGLRRRGAEAVLLDHDSPRVNRAEWKCALRPLLPAPTPPTDHPLYARKARKFFQALAKLPRSPTFPLERPGDMETYDLVIVGSDEVWNLSHPWYGGLPLFFGDGLRAKRLAAYAASFGNYDADAGLDHRWSASIAAFAKVSVRDENSRRLIRQSTGFDPALVLDPCLQFGVPREAAGEERVLAVYGHSFPSWFQAAVRRIAAERDLRVVSIGYRNDWADAQWLTAGPEDFARFMASSAAVATNFFHGCVFAIANGKPLACAASDYRRNKVTDLLALTRAERHLVSEATPKSEYRRLLAEPPRPEIGKSVAALRRRSDAYIADVLAA